VFGEIPADQHELSAIEESVAAGEGSGVQSFRTGGLHEAVDSQEPILSKRRALVGEAAFA